MAKHDWPTIQQQVRTASKNWRDDACRMTDDQIADMKKLLASWLIESPKPLPLNQDQAESIAFYLQYQRPKRGPGRPLTPRDESITRLCAQWVEGLCARGMSRTKAISKAAEMMDDVFTLDEKGNKVPLNIQLSAKALGDRLNRPNRTRKKMPG